MRSTTIWRRQRLARSPAVCRPLSAKATRLRREFCAAQPTSSSRLVSVLRSALASATSRFPSFWPAGFFGCPLAAGRNAAAAAARRSAQHRAAARLRAGGGRRVIRDSGSEGRRTDSEVSICVMRTPGPPRISIFPDDRTLAASPGRPCRRRAGGLAGPGARTPDGPDASPLLPGAVGACRAGQGRSVSRHHLQPRRVRRHSGDAPR